MNSEKKTHAVYKLGLNSFNLVLKEPTLPNLFQFTSVFTFLYYDNTSANKESLEKSRNFTHIFTMLVNIPVLIVATWVIFRHFQSQV